MNTPSTPRSWVVEFVILAAIWGSSFLFMRLGTVAFGPWATAGLRVGIAAAFLLPLLLAALSPVLARRAPVRQHIHNIYFDTPDLALERRGIALRLLQTGLGLRRRRVAPSGSHPAEAASDSVLTTTSIACGSSPVSEAVRSRGN